MRPFSLSVSFIKQVHFLSFPFSVNEILNVGDKDPCCQACWPAFDLEDPEDGRRELVPFNCSVTSTHLLGMQEPLLPPTYTMDSFLVFLLFCFVFSHVFIFQDGASLYNSPGCPGTGFINQAGLKLTEICLGLKHEPPCLAY